MRNLKVGQTITFKSDDYDEVFTRKIQSVYVQSFNKDRVRYNTRGKNGGYGCDGFGVEPEDIIKVH